MRKKHAFTLAEVLVALAILGVVVLLVMTGIRGDQHEAQLYSTQYDKVYNDVFTASKTVLTLDRKNTVKFAPSENLRDAFQGRLDIVSTWEGAEGWAEGITDSASVDAGVLAKIDGVSVDNVSGVTLSSGVSLGFIKGDDLSQTAKDALASGSLSGGRTQSASVGSSSSIAGAIIVDLNSVSNPNKNGEDQYVIPVYKDGVAEGVPDSSPGASTITPPVVGANPCAQFNTSDITCSGTDLKNCSCECNATTPDVPLIINENRQCVKDCYSPLLNDKINEIGKLGSKVVVDFESDKCWACRPDIIENCAQKQANAQQKGTGEKYVLDEDTCECSTCSSPCKGQAVRNVDSCLCECPLDDAICAAGGATFNQEECRCECPSSSGEFFDYEHVNADGSLGTCIGCPANYRLNSTATACQCDIDEATAQSQCEGGYFGFNDNTCVCYCDGIVRKSNQQLNDAAACECVENTICSAYGLGVYDKNTCTCTGCPEGFTSVGAGANASCQCVKSCGANEILDTLTCTCTACPEGTKLTNGKCIQEEDTEEDPDNPQGGSGRPNCLKGDIVIHNAATLNKIRENLSGTYCLVKNIDLGAEKVQVKDDQGNVIKTYSYQSGEGWMPIGSENRPFVGYIRGNGFKVTGLKINEIPTNSTSSNNNAGLFGVVSGSGYISELGVEGTITGTGKNSTGGLVGYLGVGGTLDNVSADMTINCTDCIATGALVGKSKGTIKNSTSTGTINVPQVDSFSDYAKVGGLVGYVLDGGLVKTSYSTADVVCGDESWDIGGLVGRLEDNSGVSHCFAIGDVTGLFHVGGLVGYASGSVQNSYATGRVEGIEASSGSATSIGGLIGEASGASIMNVYSKGDVIAADTTKYVGGIVGEFHSGATLENAYTTSILSGGLSEKGVVLGYSDPSPATLTSIYLNSDLHPAATHIACGSGCTTDSITYKPTREMYSAMNPGVEAIDGSIVGAMYVGWSFSDWCFSCSNYPTLKKLPVVPEVETNGTCSTQCCPTGTVVGITGFCDCSVLLHQGTPAYNQTTNECQTCYELDPSKPFWNPSATRLEDQCTACPSGTVYNASKNACVVNGTLGKCTDGMIAINTASDLAMIGRELVDLSGASTGTVRYPLDESYCLIQNIDLSAYLQKYENAEGWQPIGNYGKDSTSVFSGVFEGNDKTISGLNINRADTTVTNYQGLFGKVSGTINNLNVTGTVTGKDYVGGLAGSAQSATINNVTFDGTVTGQTLTGGLFGKASGGTITKAITSGELFSYAPPSGTGRSNRYFGGLIGWLDSNATIDSVSSSVNLALPYGDGGGLFGIFQGSTVANSYATGNIAHVGEVHSCAGGFAARTSNTVNISNCYSTGNVTVKSTERVGGFIGEIDSIGDIIISKCFATGNVIAENTALITAGGFIGYVNDNAKLIKDSYSSGKIYVSSSNAVARVGGFVGFCNNCKIENSYSYSEIGNITASSVFKGGLVGTGTNGAQILNSYFDNTVNSFWSEYGYARSTFELKRTPVASPVSVYSGWDSDVWCFNCGAYPVLKNMPDGAPSDTTCASGCCPAFVGVDVNGYPACSCKDVTDIDLSATGWNYPSKGYDAVDNQCKACQNVTNTTTPKLNTTTNECISCYDYTKAETAANTGYAEGTIDFNVYVRPVYDITDDGCWACSELPNGIYTPYWDKTLNNGVGACAPCPQGSVWDGVTCSTCPTGTIYDDVQGNCVVDGNLGKCTDGMIAINTASDLSKIGSANFPLNGYYCLTSDIVMTSKFTDGEGWVPLGSEANPFSGLFEGNGHSISKLTINRGGSEYQGLFASVTGFIQNLALKEVNVNGSNYTGAVAGKISGSNAVISNSYVEGAVSGAQNVGGIVGQIADSATITSVYTTGSVRGTDNIGGIAGSQSGGLVEAVYSSATVNATSTNAGGLVGEITGGSISEGYAINTVSASTNAGGFVGSFVGGTLTGYYNNELTAGTDYDNALGKSALKMQYYDSPDTTVLPSDNTDGEKDFRTMYSTWSTDRWCFACGAYPVLKNMPEGAPSATNCVIGCCPLDDGVVGAYPNCSCYGVADVNKKGYRVEENICTACYTAYPKNEENLPLWDGTACISCFAQNGVASPDWDADGLQCLACTGTTPYWNEAAPDRPACTACPADKPKWNGVTKQCEGCPAGSNFDAKGVCVLTSAQNTCSAGDIVIGDAFDLALIGNHPYYPLNGKYCQIADISLSAYQDGEGWTPIGNYATYYHATADEQANMNKDDYIFTGTFDGNGYKITDLKINRPNARSQALFGRVVGGKFKNIALDGVDIVGNKVVAPLIGYIDGTSTITNSYTKGDVVAGADADGWSYIGGLVGSSNSTAEVTIDSSYSEANIQADGKASGGLVGYAKGKFNITNSYTKGELVAGAVADVFSHAGGLVGFCTSTAEVTIDSSYSEANIQADGGAAGGLVGCTNGKLNITNSYSEANIQADGKVVGGLVGNTNANLNITNSYTKGELVAGADADGWSNAGGLVGFCNSTAEVMIDSSYSEANIQSDGKGSGGLVGGANGNLNITNSYSAATITAVSGAGVVGYFYDTLTINDSYSTADVSCSGADGCAGFAIINVNNNNPITIKNSYSAGRVNAPNATSYVGGFVDATTANTTITNSYFDTTTSGQTDPCGTTSNLGTCGVIGYPTEQMKKATLPHIYKDWDLTNTWCLYCSDYPVLRDMPNGAPSAMNCANNCCPVSSDGDYDDCECNDINKPIYNLGQNACLTPNCPTGSTGSHPDCDCRPLTSTPAYDAWKNKCVTCQALDETKPYFDGDKCTHCDPAFATENADGVCILNADTGSCTAGDIAISLPYDLAKIGVDAGYPLDGTYCQVADISLAVYGADEGWTEIGVYPAKFTGTYNGNNHKITDLYINSPQGTFGGLFGAATGATIKNLYLQGNVTMRQTVGCLAGYLYNCMIDKVVVDCNLTVEQGIAGLIAGQSGATITNSYAVGSITYTSNGVDIGGLVGWVTGAGIFDSYSAVNVTGNSSVGGITGTLSADTIIKNCYSVGSVTGNSKVGGIAGSIVQATVNNCYAIGSVTGNSEVGAIVGKLNYSSSSVNKSYYNKETTGVAVGCGSGACDAVGKTTDEMYMTPTDSIYTDWSFDSWCFSCGDYPVLKNMPEGAPEADVCDNRCVVCPAGESTFVDNACILDNAVGTCEAGSIAIYSVEDLARIGYHRSYPLDGKYCLMNDVDMSPMTTGDGLVNFYATLAKLGISVPDYTSNTGWNPIKEFSGTFDGNGHTLSGLWINNSTQSYQGLFSKLASGAIIRNLTLRGDLVWGNTYVGALAGYATDANISYVTIAVTDVEAVDSRIGGFFGYVKETSISNCISEANVYAEGAYLGGLVGYVGSGNLNISSTQVTGDVVLTDEISSVSVGGFTGGVYNSSAVITITDSSFEGMIDVDVTYNGGNSYTVGGLASSGRVIIDNSYSAGDINVDVDVTNTSTIYLNVGGLLGTSYKNSSINNSYAQGDITVVKNASDSSDLRIGGLVGAIDGTTSISASYATGNVNSSITSNINSNYELGGLVGYVKAEGTTIEDSYASGNVNISGTYRGNNFPYMGGFIGYVKAEGTTIKDSYASGNVNISGTYRGNNLPYMGGFIGYVRAEGTTIKDSYASGNVKVSGVCDGNLNPILGGFIGYLSANSSVTNTYSSGVVSSIYAGSLRKGSYIGYLGTSTITNSYSDSTKNPSLSACGEATTCGAEAKPTEELHQAQSDRVYVGWSEDDWCFSCSDYPVLKGMPDGAPSADSCEDFCALCPSGTTLVGDSCVLDSEIEKCPSGAIAIQYPEDLAQIGNNPNYPLSGTYCMLRDVSLAKYTDWTPIGYDADGNISEFTGTFEGNGHKISDLTITNSKGLDYLGLFADVSWTSIGNLAITNVNISNSSNVSPYIGALAGESSAMLKNIYVSGEINAQNAYAGGVVGSVLTAQMYYVGSAVNIYNAIGAAGIAFYIDGDINNSYSMGTIEGQDASGILGVCTASCSIRNVYFGGEAGHIFQSNDLSASVTITDSYYDVTKNPDAAVCADGICEAPNSAKTTEEMMFTPTNDIYVGWSEDDWCFSCSDYPQLKNMPNGAPSATGCDVRCVAGCPSGTKISDDGYNCVLESAIGTCQSGYIVIKSADDLAQIGNHDSYPLNGSYCLLNDIDLTGFISLPEFNTSEGWVPIGTSDEPFEGIFDGNNKTISNLKINRTGARYNGLFGQTFGAKIRNLSLENVDINVSSEQSMYVSALVGHANAGTTIDSVYAKSGALSAFVWNGDDNGETLGLGSLAGSLDGYLLNSYSNIDIPCDNFFSCCKHRWFGWCYNR